jgi:hypothetical protein
MWSNETISLSHMYIDTWHCTCRLFSIIQTLVDVTPCCLVKRRLVNISIHRSVIRSSHPTTRLSQISSQYVKIITPRVCCISVFSQTPELLIQTVLGERYKLSAWNFLLCNILQQFVIQVYCTWFLPQRSALRDPTTNINHNNNTVLYTMFCVFLSCLVWSEMGRRWVCCLLVFMLCAEF